MLNRDLIDLIVRALVRSNFSGHRRMITGRRTATGVTLDGADTGKTWVRSQDNSFEETQVWGEANRINVPVVVGPNFSGELALKDIDALLASLFVGAGASGTLLPPITPETMAALIIEGQQFRPGRLRLSEIGGLYMWVEPFFHPGGLWPGGDVLLTPPATAGMQAWCALALNPATGAMEQFTGAEFGLAVPMSVGMAGDVAFPEGYIPCGAILLANGQTAITGSEPRADLRFHLSGAGADSTGFVKTTPDSSTRNTIQPTGDYPALVAKNNAAQTVNLIEAKDSAGAVKAVVSAAGRLGIGTAAPAQLLDVDGAAVIRTLMTDASTELTIAAGAVTVTQTFHRVDTEADAVSDNLSTINGMTDGQLLILRAENAGREVVVDTAGNITTPDGNNIALDETYKFLLLVYDGNASKVRVVGGGGGGGSGSYYQTIRDDGTPVTQRAALNLHAGANVTLTIADDAGNGETDVTIAATGGGSTLHGACNGRLTLTSGTPVTTSDVTAAGTLYFTPYKGNQIGLYDGVSGWTMHTLSELSISLSGLLPYSLHDVFLDYNGGTPVLALSAWNAGTSGAIAGATNATPIVITSTAHGLASNDIVSISGVGGNTAANGIFRVTVLTANTFSLQTFTGANVAGNGAYTSGGTWYKWAYSASRATALTTQDGVYVLTGATDWRYLGTIRITGTAGQTEDSEQNRLVWNYSNRVARVLRKIDGTASWTYAVVAFRPLNNSVDNYVGFVSGLAEDAVSASLFIRISSASSAQGVVSLTSIRAGTAMQHFARSEAMTLMRNLVVALHEPPLLGYGQFHAEEIRQAGTLTLYGTEGDEAIMGVHFA